MCLRSSLQPYVKPIKSLCADAGVHADDLSSFLLQILAPFNKEINLNSKIMSHYIDDLLPRITSPGDDGNYGSSAFHDVIILQVKSPPPLHTWHRDGCHHVEVLDLHK